MGMVKATRRFQSDQGALVGHKLGGRLQLSKIGNIKIKQHRPIVGAIKTLTIRREAGCWYACFSVEYQPTRLPHNSNSIGIDVGLETFARLLRTIATTKQHKRNFAVPSARWHGERCPGSVSIAPVAGDSDTT